MWLTPVPAVQRATRHELIAIADDCDRIENGLIRRIEMIGDSGPFHLNSPWGGLSGR